MPPPSFAFPDVTLPPGAAQLRADVRAFLAAEHDRGTELGRPDSWLSGWDPGFSRRLAERGWVGMTLPVEYGGGGCGALERYVVIEELLAAGAPVAAHWVADRQAGPSLLRHGSERQRRRHLPAIAAGRATFAIGMSERDAGSDLASVATRAERTAGGWRITGTKMWTGNAHLAEHAIVLARTDPDAADRHDGLSQFVVDLGAPGVRVEPIRLLTGEHRFNAVHLDGVEGDLLGEEGAGWAQVTGELAHERSGPERFLSTVPLLLAALRSLPDPAPGDRASLGRLVARLATLRHMSLGVATALDAGTAPDVEAAVVKDLGTRFEGELVEQVRHLLPAAADPSAPRGSTAELLALALSHSPAYTLRGGTNEILRGIVVKGWSAVPAAEPTTSWWRILSTLPDPAAPLREVVAAARDLGRATAPGPFAEHLAARSFAAEHGLALPEGAVTVIVEAGDRRPRVPWASGADALLVVNRDRLAFVASTPPTRPGTDLAGRPCDTVLLDKLPLPDDTLRVAPADVERLRDRLELLRAADAAGAAQRCAELTADHVATRHQFGRALAGFQSVKQDLARLLEEAALVASAVEAAVHADGARTAVLAASVQARTSVGEIVRIAHQLHGAIGFTELSPLRFATTRLWAFRDTAPGEDAVAARLGSEVLAAPDAWSLLVDGSGPVQAM